MIQRYNGFTKTYRVAKWEPLIKSIVSEGALEDWNYEIRKKSQTKFNYGNLHWFEGPNGPEIREYAEQKAYNYLKNKFSSEYA